MDGQKIIDTDTARSEQECQTRQQSRYDVVHDAVLCSNAYTVIFHRNVHEV